MIVGADLRAARRDAGLSLGQLAARTGVSAGHLSRVERGDREVTPSLVLHYQTALGPAATALAALLDSDSGAPEKGTVDDMKRRGLLSVIAAASMGVAAGEPVTRLLDGLAGDLPTRVGLPEVHAVEAAADLYMRMDLARGGDAAIAMARGTLEWAVKLHDRPMAEPTRERLSSAVGLLADRLGWATYDQGRAERAARILTFALDSAARGADRDLRAHTMLDLSVTLTDLGSPRDGVEILRLALGDERISSAERANLHAVAARHCATAGDRAAGLRHIGLAEEALGRAEPALAPDWAHHITVAPGHHDSALGLALFQLGEDARARDHLTAALGRLGESRTRTGLRCLIRLAVLRVREGDRDAGAEQARRAVALAAEVRSTRVAGDLRMMVDGVRACGMTDLARELARSLPPSDRPAVRPVTATPESASLA
ncbi:helix-turn-helix domain-containing protein [Sphaerisporangium sp. NPDC005289]|uniref:helix-turn-helix domain-containing protein n=1 Tax=Sphaerisporangium sp. NPDC005289 TaxID=3155247 RepID=UPI0033B077B6